jgi:hypothetical protein
LRRSGYKGPAVLVLYLGNDLYEQALWNRIGLSDPKADASIWPMYRQSILPPPVGVPVAPNPCWVTGSNGLSRRHEKGLTPEILRKTALYRAFLVSRNSVRNWWLGKEATSSDLASFLRRSCLGPGSKEIKSRIFFEDVRVEGMEAFEKSGLHSLIESLRELEGDAKISLVIVRTREDVCRTFHHLPAKAYDSAVRTIKELQIPVLDPSSTFAERCLQEELFLPDGHWNTQGHLLFANAVRPLVPASGAEPPS